MSDASIANADQFDEPDMISAPPVEEYNDDGCDETWHERFRQFAESTAKHVGSPWAFGGAAAVIVAWAASGPMFKYSDTWQLVINTGTTIVTFLMVFLIQNTQNRDARAIHLKLSELIRATESRNRLIDVEACTEAELDSLESEFKRLREHHINFAKRRNGKTNGSKTTCSNN